MNPLMKYQADVANRLAEAKNEGLFDATMKVRNQEGLMQTFSRILDTAQQYVLEDPNRAKDPAIALATFSRKQNGNLGAYSASGASVGVGGAANLRTMDAIDISISAAAFSLLPYLAIERSMPSSSTNISYQDIITEFENGELAAGETVLGAFEAPNTKLSMALPMKSMQVVNDTESVQPTMTMQFGCPLMPETSNIQLLSASTVVANGIDHGGVVYFKGSAAVEGTVDYKKGIITFTNVPAGFQVTVTVNLDSTADTTGANSLTLTTEYKNVILTAKPRQLIFRDNNLKNAYLNKLNIQIAGTGLTMDYGEMAVGKLISIYIHYVNRLVVNDTILAGNRSVIEESSKGLAPITCDISNYTGSAAGAGYADTKFDYIKGFVIDLNQRSLDVSGKGLTALLVGSRGANQLSNTPDFVKSAQYDELNAMIGTYDGYPVIRHQNVDVIEPLEDGQHKTAFIYGLYKDPSGNAAPVAFGEFLPVSLTGPVANFNNPEQIARSMSSYCGTTICVAGLCHLGTLKFRA